MKDLTVGNRFVYYGYNGSTTSTVAFYEEVIDETYINGFTYGVVFNSFSQSVRYERSDSNKLYEFYPNTNSEGVTHCFQMACSMNAWAYFPATTFSPRFMNSLHENEYSLYEESIIPPVRKTLSIGYKKPFGINFISTSTYIGSYVNPNQCSRCGYYTEPYFYGSGASLVGAVIQGRVIGDTTFHASLKVNFDTVAAIPYGKTLFVPLLLSALPAFVQIPKVDSIKCRIDIDTNALEVVSIRNSTSRVPGNIVLKADSIGTNQNNTTSYFLTFPITSKISPNYVLSFFELRSKSQQATTSTLRISNVVSFPQNKIESSAATIYLTTRTIALGVQNIALPFGKKQEIPVFVYDHNGASPVGIVSDQLLNLQMLNFTTSVDTTLIDLPVFYTNTKKEIAPHSVETFLGRFLMTFQVPANNLQNGQIGVILTSSKSLKNTSTSIEFLGTISSVGYQFTLNRSVIILQPVPANTTPLTPEVITKAEQGKNAIQYLAPNPATDNVRIRYVVAKLGIIEVLLFDNTGRPVYISEPGQTEKGIYEIVVPLQQLSNGTYTVHIRSEGGIEIRQLVVIH